MVIDIKPETEELLRQELSNGHFLTVEEIIIRGLQAGPLETMQTAPLGTPQQRATAFRNWYQSLQRSGVVLPDEAMERASFYGDRG